jgi:aspartate aminotransferase-like enzyme
MSSSNNRQFWKTYELGLIPGPTTVSAEVSAAYAVNFAATDLEADFFDYYAHMQKKVQKLLNTDHEIVFMTGEAMVTLWGALKSVLQKGDVVLSVGCGLFGEGFGEMAKQLGAEVHAANFEWDDPNISEASMTEIRHQIATLRPKLVTSVHCETPCGSINTALAAIGKLAKENGALFLVDAVSSVGGVPIYVNAWDIDLCLVGSQKALCCPPEFSFLSVSPNAWNTIEKVKYVGYDALLPFKTALEVKEFPYTPSWRALAALEVSLDAIEKEGIENVFERHRAAQAYTMSRLRSMSVRLYLQSSNTALASPTVTAAYVPEKWTWKEFDSALRAKGLAIGGTYGKIAGQVFRIGHMGIQADLNLLTKAMDIMEQVIASRS